MKKFALLIAVLLFVPLCVMSTVKAFPGGNNANPVAPADPAPAETEPPTVNPIYLPDLDIPVATVAPVETAAETAAETVKATQVEPNKVQVPTSLPSTGLADDLLFAPALLLLLAGSLALKLGK